jgi:hypothetical protein
MWDEEDGGEKKQHADDPQMIPSGLQDGRDSSILPFLPRERAFKPNDTQ